MERKIKLNKLEGLNALAKIRKLKSSNVISTERENVISLSDPKFFNFIRNKLISLEFPEEGLEERILRMSENQIESFRLSYLRKEEN